MATYKIEQVDPTVAFIITRDDEPMTSASTGEPFKYLRRVDAERAVAKRQTQDADTAELARDIAGRIHPTP